MFKGLVSTWFLGRSWYDVKLVATFWWTLGMRFHLKSMFGDLCPTGLPTRLHGQMWWFSRMGPLVPPLIDGFF